MFGIRKETLERLRKEYPIGCRVELTMMSDPYNARLCPGEKGRSYEQYDSRTLAGEYLPSNRQQKQFTGNERIDGVHGSASR